MKKFIAVTSETYQQRLVLLNTSAGRTLYNPDGIGLDASLDFLFSLINLRGKGTTVFVVFGFSRDNEFLFSLLQRQLRDKLFQSTNIKEQLARLEFEKECLDDLFYRAEKDSDTYAEADLGRYVNELAIRELLEVEYNGYKIKLANGKKLTISRGKRTISFYDIYGFFKPTSLRKAVKTFCGTDLPHLERSQLLGFNMSRDRELTMIQTHSHLEVAAIAALAENLNNRLLEIGINITRYHGATAVTSWFLGKSRAKKEFYNYRYKRQLSANLSDAVHKAFFAGRAEQIKIGTIENVYTYDINSAYAYAAAMLPQMLQKPSYRNDYREDEPFSFWHVDFDFTKAGINLGVFPFRGKGGITYPLRGSGFYWQPEIKFALEHYPSCVKIGHGYVLPYRRAAFAQQIPALYDKRLELQAAGNPLEKVLKLALASLYGKFCQHNGKGSYYNLFYAGFITSVVRRMLLDAMRENPSAIICFLTDCIHSTEPLNLPQSNVLGDWKAQQYARVRYLDSGIYECYTAEGRIIKTKTKGFRALRFNLAAFELQRNQVFSATSEFFVGHNVYTQHLFQEAKYLENIIIDKTNKPFSGKGREFDFLGENLLETFIDSKIIKGTKQESAPYQASGFKDADLALDTIEARRV